MNLMRIILSERRLLKRLQTPRLISCDMFSKAKLQGGLDQWLPETVRACCASVVSDSLQPRGL